jgi:hypothetical protein
MGGSNLFEVESGAQCTMTRDLISTADQRGDTGFRCCFSTAPRL